MPGDLGWEDPLGEGRHGNPLQYSHLENPHGQRSLAGYSLWGRKESDMTESLSTQHARQVLTFVKCCLPQDTEHYIESSNEPKITQVHLCI